MANPNNLRREVKGVISMRGQCAVPAGHLCRTWDPASLGFSTTEELPELEGLVGQEQAVRALQFGLSFRSPGYNIYVAGPSGTGKTSYTTSLVKERAAQEQAPSDWVYVHNFENPDEPLAIALPAGWASTFAQEMDEVVQDAQNIAGRAIGSKEHQNRREELLHALQQQVEQVMHGLEQMAEARQFGLTHTEQGLMPVPLQNGQPMTEEQFDALPADKRREMTASAQEIQRAAAEARHRTWEVEKTVRAELQRLDREVANEALGPTIEHLLVTYQRVTPLVAWLKQMAAELIGPAIPDSSGQADAAQVAAAAERSLAPRRREDPFSRFRVNVLVAQPPQGVAPVVIEPNPTYVNLFGKAEYVTARNGDESARHMQIKAGAVHRANGGYLILQAADLLASPHAWDALKRALTSREARIEAPSVENRIIPVEMLRPQPVALDLKVILIGSSQLYHALYSMDEGFRKQFKFKAEFDLTMEANERNVAGYASFVARVCRREGLRHMTAAGVSQVLAHSHRLSEDQSKLSARFNDVVEVIYEANAWAGQARSPLVDAGHVKQAVVAKAGRAALPEQHQAEMIRRGDILVAVSGAVVGQVNGLTVMSTGDYRFGSPSRITARVYMGQKGVLHIEREVEMSGHIHDKGLFTLTGYLGERFAHNKPLAFSASIAFEQTYMPIDGDSASSAELFVLLSALADLPIDQGIAVTGSVNQRGEIQPIGGVNEKIEGYFRVCMQLGLTRRQGVIIPRQNVHNLQLADDVIDAIESGQFHLWAIDSVEQGIELLTGVPAGGRGADGGYTPGSLFDRVDHRIEQLARQFAVWNKGGIEN